MNTQDIKILIVDDEPDTLEFMQYNIEKEGYQAFTAPNGKEAIQLTKQEHPHLIILDVMMPEMDGIETCRQIRELPNGDEVLIAFLTARNEDYSEIAGFDVGGDDYITKPIKPRVLLSRIKGLLRRYQGDDLNNVIEAGPFTIDREQFLVYQNNESYSLPKKEFELLALLAGKPGRVFTRKEILNKVWGKDVIVGDRTIDVHVRKLRERFGNKYIQTVKGVGYKLET